ncbi:MAG: hypothetical protein IPJ25_06790 [Rhodocyclaceae bacterium]|nr:hypothetical protein [Rhodocyclaceae bacterium]
MNWPIDLLTSIGNTLESLLTRISWSMSFPTGALEFVYPVLFLLAPLPLLLTAIGKPFQSRFEAIHIPFFRELRQLRGRRQALVRWYCNAVGSNAAPARQFGYCCWQL